MNEVLELVKAFFADARVKTLAGLILFDLVLAVAAALKLGTFDWKELPRFYKTKVCPYLLGYLAGYVATFLIVGEWAGGFVTQTVVTLLWAMPVGNLVANIVAHLKSLGIESDKQ